jgi:hypothetical protein
MTLLGQHALDGLVAAAAELRAKPKADLSFEFLEAWVREEQDALRRGEGFSGANTIRTPIRNILNGHERTADLDLLDEMRTRIADHLDRSIASVERADSRSSDGSAQSQPAGGAGPIARSTIGQSILVNHAQMTLSAASLLLLIDEKIEAFTQERRNSPEADEEIAIYKRLREQLLEFQEHASDFAMDQADEGAVVRATTSFADGIKKWWHEDHVSICNNAFDSGLFLLSVGICKMAGAGADLSILASGILVRGRDFIEGIKAWRRTGGGREMS